MTKEQIVDNAVDAFLKIEGRALRLQMGCEATRDEWRTFFMGYSAGCSDTLSKERERILSQLESQRNPGKFPAYEDPVWDDAIDRAVEIVKGEDATN